MIAHDVEQRSPEWYALRAGMPTASEFSKIVTSKGEPSKSASGYAMTLAAELFAGRPIDAWEGNAWSERGQVLETEALALYQFARDVEVEPVGFVTDDAKTMGCSPDGMVGADGLIETKCLKAERHVDVILYFQTHQRCKPEYVQQPQGQMLVTGRKWCDLMFFHPVLPPLIIRQEPDPSLQKALTTQIPLVLRERDRIFASLEYQAGTRKKAA